MKKLLLILLFTFHFSPLTFAQNVTFQAPAPGSYTCFDVGNEFLTGTPQPTGAVLELHPDNTYTLSAANQSEQGTFSTFIDPNLNSDFLTLFQSGAGMNLTSANASYDALYLVSDAGGSFIIVILSDSSGLRCESPGANMNMALYGNAKGLDDYPVDDYTFEEPTIESELLPATTKAPAPPAGAGGLSGLYFYEDKDGEYVPTFANNVASGYFEFHNEYLYFMPNGYVYEGIYNWSYEALDCSRVTKYENTPLCNTYVITNNTITYGQYAQYPRSFEKAGNDLYIDGKYYQYLQPADGLTFDGRFLFAQFDGYTLDEAYYTFSKDGTFQVESSSSNNATASVGGTTTYSSSYSETPITVGAYVLRNNTIEFLYDDGRSLKRVFHFEANAAGQVEYIYINGTIYSRE